ncbi:hypothetical protein [Legionella sp. WA2022007384]
MQTRFDNTTRSDTTHLVIYFCGTGNPGTSFENLAAPYLREVSDKVTTVFVNGCDHPEVCNSTADPDLSKFAARFTKTVFRTENGQLFLSAKDLTQLKVGIKWNTQESATKPIDKISLVGYSRGAVTTFEIGNELNKLQQSSGIVVPVRIVAEQPVPGNYTNLLPSSVVAHASNCVKAINIESATIILAAYAPQLDEGLNFIQKKMHAGFFSQMVPKFHKDLQPELIFIPRQHHWSPFMGHELHMMRELMKGLRADGLISSYSVNELTRMIKEQYQAYPKKLWAFPRPSQLQDIFNVDDKKELYQHIDEYHPDPAPYKAMGEPVSNAQNRSSLFSFLSSFNPSSSGAIGMSCPPSHFDLIQSNFWT